jgi:hypothetical protein
MQRVSTLLREVCCAISRGMNYHNSLEGLTATAKTTIAAMNWRKHFSAGEQAYWDKALKHFELQKDLLYATVFFQSAGEFIKKTVVFNADGTSTTSYSFQPPGKDCLESFSKVSAAVGNFFEMIQCSMKWIFGTPVILTKAGNRLGSTKVPLPLFGPTAFDRIPVAQAIVRKPKDFFIFVSDTITVLRYVWEFVLPPNDDPNLSFVQSLREQYSWNNKVKFAEHICKFVSSLGKMILILTGGYYSETGTFRNVDVITQLASQGKFILKKEIERDNHLAGR